MQRGRVSSAPRAYTREKGGRPVHLGDADLGAEVGLARVAELAIAALGNVKRNDVITCIAT